jgi:hypothetical protein
LLNITIVAWLEGEEPTDATSRRVRHMQPKSLEKVYSEKSFDISSSLESDLVLDSLHRDPRFQNLLGRIGLN